MESGVLRREAQRILTNPPDGLDAANDRIIEEFHGAIDHAEADGS